ncbi:beta propeller repeat protein, partial [Actinomadura sediminis]
MDPAVGGGGPQWVVRAGEQAVPARFTAPQPAPGSGPWLGSKAQPAARDRARMREAPGPAPEAAPAAFDRPQSTPTPPGPAGQRVFRPGLRSGIAVAAVATLVAGGVAYLLKDGGVPGVGAGPGAGGAADASGVFAVQPALYDGHEQAITGVAVAGETAVTVGSETVDRPRGQILVSADGAEQWSVAEVRPEGGASPFDVPRVVAVSGKAWAALGAGPAGVAVWTSADGRTWAHRSSPRGFQRGDEVVALTAAQAGFAAAGTGHDGKQTLWTSADGVAWQRAAASFEEPPTSVAATGGAVVVLTEKGELWRSADDGGAWTRAEVPEADGSYGPVVALANGPGGFFAAREGKDGDRRRAVFYRSADGVGWTRASIIDRRTYDRLAALNGTSEGLAALVPLTDGRLAVQRSDDGVKWESVERLDTGGGKDAATAAALPKGVLVAGTQDNGAYLTAPGARHGDIDLLAVPGAVTPDRTLTRLVSAGGTTLAIGSGAGDAAVWTTRDGGSWTRAGGGGLGGPAGQRLADAAHG